LPILSILLAGALLCAVTGYILSFKPPPVHAYSARTDVVPTKAPQIITEGMIDINAASLNELMTLPGIGEKTAQSILALRDELGAFRFKEDLLLVKGIGQQKLNAISELIYIR